MPPCNCHPPFPRPEPFSPLPRPGKTPDWGKWIRDRLAEKGALLVLPTRASFPNPGAWPNLYLDLETGAVYRWDREDYSVLVDPREGNDVLVYDSVAAFPDEGEQGKLYIAANTGSLYRWGGGDYAALLPGKADRAVPQTAGNLAALTQDGNLVDSGKKPADFADAANTYTIAQTEEAIDRVAAYYITYDAAGNPFPTYAALANATTVYSGGKVRTPTRNDYCVVLADETHQGAEYRYIYAVADGETTGSWQPQFPVEGVMTVDQAVVRGSQNPVSGGGVWSMLWGNLQFIPEGLSSVYAWVLNRLGLKRDYTDLSYDTTKTVEVPALHATMKYGGQTLFDYNLFCTEDIPDPPVYNHLYTWRADGGVSPGAEVYVTQMVSALTTTWTLYSQTSEVLDTVQTSNSGDLYPDFTFSTASGMDVDIHKTTAQKTVTVEDTIALESKVYTKSQTDTLLLSKVPTSRTVNGKPLSSNVTLTGADITVSGTDATKIDAALAGKATKADATLAERFSAWTLSGDVETGIQYEVRFDFDNEGTTQWGLYRNGDLFSTGSDNPLSTSEDFPYGVYPEEYTITATRTALSGYQLGSQTDKPLANDADVVHKTGDETIMGVKTFDGNAVVTGDMTIHGFTKTMGVTLNDVARGYVGGDSPLDHVIHIRTFEDTDLGLPAGDVTIPRANGMVALTADLRYALTTKTVDNGAVTLDDRAMNAVAVSSSLASLTVNFPTATSGKARDFGLRLTVASGITTAPQIVLPQGVTCENADGEAPEIGADGAATILYFTETASGVFLVKGEVLQTITQA